MTETVQMATVLREPLEQTLRFVSWYCELGVERIELFFDDPQDPAIELVETRPEVRVHRCTADFWRGIGAQPDMAFVKRQNAALTFAYRGAKADWFLAVDSDEFVYLQGRNFDEFLRSVPDDAPAVRFCTAEHVTTPGHGGNWFRLPLPRAVIRQNGGAAAFYLAPRGGLVGHADGKSLTRTGFDVFRVRQHLVVGRDRKPIDGIFVGPANGAMLLHFVDNGYDRWRAKLAWRRGSWGLPRRASARLDEIDRFPAEEAEREYRALYDLLHQLEPETCEKLEGLGGVIRLDVDTHGQIDRIFPGHGNSNQG
ncbi:glycosyltransferase family 2 protein [Paracoccus isoporae]|nr:glycosyltransferase family 2 protein [Paracoccus isoporae]